MKVYVAGKFEDRDIVRQVYRELKSKGHEITLDWTDHEHSKTTSEQAKWAVEDIEGVKRCDVLIAVLISDYRYRGALIEIGAALALGKRVITLGRNENSSTFLYHPLVTKLDNLWEWEGMR